MKFWTTKNSNFLLKSVSFCRKHSYNLFDTNYKYINVMYNSYYDKVSKYEKAKIDDFGRINKRTHFKGFCNSTLELLCKKMISDWHKPFKVLSVFRICYISKRFICIFWSIFLMLRYDRNSKFLNLNT